MVLATVGVNKQSRASSGGIKLYPQISSGFRDSPLGDEFERENLQPTNWPVIYTQTANGTDNSAMQTDGKYRLETGSTIGNDVSLRVSEIKLRRTFAIPIDEIASQVEIICVFRPTPATSTEGFVGIMFDSNSALSALPTTAAHCGIYWDTSAETNYFLTSGNGSAQSTTDTSTAVSTTIRRLRIFWTGANTVTIQLINNNTNVVLAEHNVTDINSSTDGTIHWWIQTETGANRSLDAFLWYAISK